MSDPRARHHIIVTAGDFFFSPDRFIERSFVGKKARTPELTPERRAAALEIASRTRAGRKETKEKLAAGEIALAEVVESEDEAIRQMRVIDLIKAMPG